MLSIKFKKGLLFSKYLQHIFLEIKFFLILILLLVLFSFSKKPFQVTFEKKLAVQKKLVPKKGLLESSFFKLFFKTCLILNIKKTH